MANQRRSDLDLVQIETLREGPHGKLLRVPVVVDRSSLMYAVQVTLGECGDAVSARFSKGDDWAMLHMYAAEFKRVFGVDAPGKPMSE